MRLEKLHVANFRCVDDSTEFNISDVTCLVGKNESGKTTILQAVERLNPQDPQHAEYDRVRDYPRRYLSDYEERHKDGPATVVRSTWSLTDDEVSKLEESFGKDCLISRAVIVEKRYQKGTPFLIPLNDTKILSYLIRSAECTPEEAAPLAEFKTCKELYDHIVKVGDGVSEQLKKLKDTLGAFPKQSIQEAAWGMIEMPKFMYFSQYDRMSGDVSIDQLKKDIASGVVTEGDRVFQDFIKFSGTTLDQLSNINQYEQLTARVEAASIKITDQIFEYWSQNQHLKVRFTIESGKQGDQAPFNDGPVMHARVYNDLHEMTVPFSERSAGFIWFFSFLVSFSQVKKDHGNVIILLDEPGLNLHGRAQADLLRYIDEKLRPDHQVIFTTHSPFMVPQGFDRIRTVEDVVVQDRQRFRSIGTKVGGDVLSTDPDTLFPLQAALGYEITQNLFIGPHTLLVEGPSDILYLKAFSNELSARGRTSLDKRWVICPSEGIDKVSAFLSLFGGNKLHIAVLLDYAKGQKNKVDSVKKHSLLQAGHIFAATDFVTQDEADVEDMLGTELYIKLVNDAFGQQLVSATVLSLAPETPRLVRKVEVAFKTLPLGAPEFDHYSPASWLIENPKELRGKSAAVTEALDRFEDLFRKLNALLPAK